MRKKHLATVAMSSGMLGFALLCASPAADAQQRGPEPNRGDRDRDGVADVRAGDHAVEVYLSEDALQAQYIRQLVIDDFGPLEARGGFFYNEDRDLIAVVDALTMLGEPGDPAPARNLEVRVGSRLFGAFLNVEDQDVFGVGFGGEAEYFFSSDRRTSVTLALFYAPDILTFGEADNFADVSLRLQTRLRQGTDVFVGVRSFEIDTSVEDREVDDNLHIGFRRTF
jgi:hypothetical protein